jgi:hypothetical protein
VLLFQLQQVKGAVEHVSSCVQRDKAPMQQYILSEFAAVFGGHAMLAELLPLRLQ